MVLSMRYKFKVQVPAHNSTFRLVKGLSHTAPISFPHNEHTHIYMANAM
jgi:hypothetical protein